MEEQINDFDDDVIGCFCKGGREGGGRAQPPPSITTKGVVEYGYGTGLIHELWFIKYTDNLPLYYSIIICNFETDL